MERFFANYYFSEYNSDTNLLKVLHSEGFFSCCTIRLRSILEVNNIFNILPIVDSSRQFSFYKDVDDIDITDKFFKKVDVAGEAYDKEIKITDLLYEEQFSDYSKINFNDINFLIKKYFTLSDEVIKISFNLLKKYNIKLNETISVLYRGNDKSIETVLPTYEEMYLKLKEVKDLYPNYKILVQSDEIEFIDYIKNYYSNCIVIEEISKINKAHTAIQYVIEKGNRILQAQIFLAILNIISKTSKIIFNSGNISMWCCFLRRNSTGTYQYLKHNREYYYPYKYLKDINYNIIGYPPDINDSLWFNNDCAF